MRRRKFLRFLVPALLAPFLVLLVLAVRQRPTTRTEPDATGVPSGPRVEDLKFDDLLGASRRLSLTARVGWQDAQGTWRLEGVERLEIERENAAPIVIKAERGGVTGAPGKRVFRLEGGVEIREKEEGLLVSLPTLEVDQVAGVARSLGDVTISGPTFEGQASSIVYGLHGQPTEVQSLTLRTKTGATLTSPHALLRKGTEEAELTGGVQVVRGATRLDAGSARLFRGKEGKIEKAFAEAGVVATDATPGRPPSRMRARAAELRWDASGEPAQVFLRGDAEVAQGEGSIASAEIEVRKDATTGAMALQASDGVVAKGIARQGAGELRSDALVADLDAKGTLERGKATGRVQFLSPDASGEAAVGTFGAGPGKGTVVLEAGPGRRARVARGTTRVVADRITSAVDGSSLVADGRVEATLLPQERATAPSPTASTSGLFSTSSAIHFVGDHLEAEAGGKRLTFRGTVRGWQGDRNLSAEEVSMDQEHDTLAARGKVSTRMPRATEKATGAADFLQVSSETLDYSGGSARGVYTGSVKAKLADGWIESARLEVDLVKETSAVHEARAFDDVKMEFRSAVKEGQPRPTMTGEGDRLVYTPDEKVVRIFGDKRPATVRRSGESGGTSTGRVLRYRLDLGTLEVESGERDRARIRPSTNGT